MEIQQTSGGRVTVFVPESDLIALGVFETNQKQSLMLTDIALDRLGVAVRDIDEIELFTGSGGVLIFARYTSRLETRVYAFGSVASALDFAAATGFPREPKRGVACALFECCGGVYAILKGFGKPYERVCLVADEFGGKVTSGDSFILFLNEHGARKGHIEL